MNLIKHTHRGMTPWFDDIDRWFDTAFAPIAVALLAKVLGAPAWTSARMMARSS